MISGRAVTIEIGHRALVKDAGFLVATGEKVGLVGRNGTGKSTLISVLVGEVDPEVRFAGEIKTFGTVGYLPQVPNAKGLGVDATGFSHVLSGRGLDVVDEKLVTARNAMTDDPTAEAIELFSELQEQYGSLGGYEAEATMARLATVGEFELGDIVIGKQNGNTLSVLWSVKVNEIIDGQTLSTNEAPRITAYVWNGKRWQVLAHGNFNVAT